MSTDEHFCGCCGEQIGAGTRSDPSWCARCKPHIKGYTDAPLWDRTYFAQHKQPCPFQVGSDGSQPADALVAEESGSLSSAAERPTVESTE